MALFGGKQNNLILSCRYGKGNTPTQPFCLSGHSQRPCDCIFHKFLAFRNYSVQKSNPGTTDTTIVANKRCHINQRQDQQHQLHQGQRLLRSLPMIHVLTYSLRKSREATTMLGFIDIEHYWNLNIRSCEATRAFVVFGIQHYPTWYYWFFIALL